MKFTGLVNRLLVGAAVLSMIVSTSPAIAGGIALPSSRQVVQPVMDVSLMAGGVFRGQVVAADGQPSAGAAVVLQQGTQRVAETISDENGAFAFQGVSGGTYVVSTDGVATAYRLWAANTAPPAAQPAAMLVKSGETVRGQFGGGASGVIITSLVVGGIVWGVVEISNNAPSS